MKKLAPVGLALLAAIVLAQGEEGGYLEHTPGQWFSVITSRFDGANMPTAFGAASGGDPLAGLPRLPYFLFAPTSAYRTETAQIDAGTGLPVSRGLCGAVDAGERVSFVCVEYGANASGVAYPFGIDAGAETVTVCPDGPTCRQRTGLRHTASAVGAMVTEAHDAGAGELTACMFGMIETLNAAAFLQQSISTTPSGSGSSWSLRNTGGFFVAGVSCGVTDADDFLAYTYPDFAPHLYCLTYKADAGVQAFLDGTGTGSPNTTCSTGRNRVVASVGWNGVTVASGPPNLMLGVMKTEYWMSPDRVSSLARDVLADRPFALLSDAGTVNLTVSHATARFCASVADGDVGSSGSMLPAARACVTRNGIDVQPQKQNVVIRWAEIDNGAWVANGSGGSPAPSKGAANSHVAPDGTMTAEVVEFADCGGVNATSFIYQSPALAAAASWGLWARSTDGGTQAFSLCANRDSAAFSCEAQSVGGGGDTSWKRVAYNNISFTGAGVDSVQVGCNNSASYTGASNTGAAGLVLWGGQANLGATLGQGCPTVGAAAICSTDHVWAAIPWSGTSYVAFSTINTGRSVSNSERAATLFWDEFMFDDSYFPSVWQAYFYAGATYTTNSALGMASGDLRVGSGYDGTYLNAWRAGVKTSTTRTIAIAGTPVTVRLGVDALGGSVGPLGGVIKNVCVLANGTPDAGCAP